MSKHRSFVISLYHLLLYLYPPAFRRRFAAEILALFTALHADASRRSALPLLYVSTFVDMCINIPAAWWETLHSVPLRRWYAAIAVLVMLFSLIT